MNENEEREIREILKQSFPAVSTELRQDLWPAVSRRLEARPAPVPWYDWALLAVSAGVLLFFPHVMLLFAYHL
jgi:hypothetical protein